MIKERLKINENDSAGKIFEENITKTLELELNWKKSKIPRYFFFRKFTFHNSSETNIIYSGNSLDYVKNNEIFLTFMFDEDSKACEIKNHKTSKMISITENEKDFEYEELRDIFIISPLDRIEIDGIYDIYNFSPPKFKENEVSIIYQNINKFRENKMMEVKLNKGKIFQLIDQFKRDNEIMRRIIPNKIIFIGFVGNDYKKNFDNYDFNTNIGDLKCIIYEVKKNELFERNLKQSINWRTEIDLKKLTSKMDRLIDSFGSFQTKINKKINNLNEKVANIENKVEVLDIKVVRQENKIDELEIKFYGMENRVDKLKKKIY